ncbi:MAG: SagB/ThcOx family dehydrogenase [Candidatus Aminicenantales bacterium]
MHQNIRVIGVAILVAVISGTTARGILEAKDLPLPKPRMEGGMPLLDALRQRSSAREFSAEKLPLQTLSDLLWAADGINRPESGKRTAPSAVNWQNIDIYVASADGLRLYKPATHALEIIRTEDVRKATGSQDFVSRAAINLIYVADMSKIDRGTDREKEFNSAAHTGFISQNVYLFCASEGLATVVRGSVDREALAGVLKLRPDQKVMLAQSVGYPKTKS